MFKFLIIFICIQYRILFAYDPVESNEWKKVLYFTSNGSREVVDNDFYLSNSFTPKAEYEEFISQLKTDSAKDLVCNFPARYMLIREKNREVPNFDLNKCKSLQIFIQSFKLKNLSFIMTSELMNAPASAFGHIMLALHDEEIPELDSDVIHFSAITSEEDSFYKYAKNGLTGGYFGYFIRNKFFEKYHEYSSVEQRYMFSYKMKVSAEQKKMLLYHLYELRKARFNYYFLNKNCAFRLNQLIAITLGTKIEENSFYTLPIEITSKYKDYFFDAIKFHPYSTMANNSIQKLTAEERSRFDTILKGEKRLSDTDTEELKKSIFYYYSYNFKKNNIQLINFKDNLDRVDFDPIPRRLKNDRVVDPLIKNPPKKFSFSYGNLDGSKIHRISFRPALIDIDQFQKYNLHESELSLLKLSLENFESKYRFHELELFSAKVITPSSKYFNSNSWQSEVVFKRAKTEEEEVGISSLVGLGKTYAIFGHLSSFLNVGLFVTQKYIEPFIEPELGFITYVGKLKLHCNYTKRFYSEQSIESVNGKFGYSFSRQMNFYINYRNYINKEEVLVGLDLHF